MHEELMEQVVAGENLEQALRAVMRNRGAAGIDRMTVHELEPHFRRHGEKIRAKLLAGQRGQASAWHSDGDGPADSTSDVAGVAADL